MVAEALVLLDLHSERTRLIGQWFLISERGFDITLFEFPCLNKVDNLVEIKIILKIPINELLSCQIRF